MSGPDIFISYSREDRAAARHFAECFVQDGFSVWWDAALHSGETFDEVIESELKAAKAVVVLWSPRSVASRWVRAEATLADRRNKLAPAIIEPCDRPIIFELTHTADLSHWSGDTTDDAWQAFVQDLRRLVNGSKASVASAPSSRSAAGRRPDYTRAPAARFTKSPSNSRSNAFAAGKVDDLMQALAKLQDVIGAPGQGAAEEGDESDRTQFYTRSGGFGAFDTDELHCLEITDGDRLEKRYVISPIGLKIGRTAPADIILADARVSRAHCMVELADNQLRVSDLNSTNGTFVDGERIAEATILEVGSVLRVGNVCFKHEVRTRAEV